MFICVCKAVRKKDLDQQLDQIPGAGLEDIQRGCGAGSDCGSCIDRIEQLIRDRNRNSVTVETMTSKN